MAATDSPIRAPRGLKNVIVTDTELGDVRPEAGRFHYRGYDAVHLARACTFEQVAHLMLAGHLADPQSPEQRSFSAALGQARMAGERYRDLITALAGAGTSPLLVTRTALSAYGADSRLAPVYDASPADRAQHALTVVAMTPTLLAAAHRVCLGLEPIPPDPGLPHATDYVRMVTGHVPTPADARALERYLIATIDHGFNASTFTARVVASTGADVVSAVVAAIGAFLGPLHGGAPDRALAALEEIGDPAGAEAWVRGQISAGRRIMGFGHAVYRGRDPRAELLTQILADYDDPLITRARQVELAVEQALAEVKPGRELHANVEFYAGVLMRVVGLPETMFTPTFAAARVVGWAANILEQAADPAIIRPLARYVGPLH